ncbi:MAG: Transcriptional regulator, LysR-family [Frankiales bacterium]|nr:Transcriptional regulator, LysR-family [Frankiales bacterium]
MEFRHLEYFLAVVEEGSFTGAAGRLYMVQSSLSAALLGLERELRTDLFIRGRRGAELTDAGRAFLGPARAALAEAGRARDAVAEVVGLLRGSVRIAAVAVPGSVDVVETIRRFATEHPGVDIHLVPVGAQQMVDLVADGQVDFAITPRVDRLNPGLHFEPLISAPVVLICPSGHKLAGAREIDVCEVVDEAIIDLPRGWHARALFDRMLEERCLARRVRLEVNEWLSVLTMVQRGLGVSYGPRACIDPDIFCGIDVATLTGAPVWELGVVTRDEALRGAAGRAFLSAYLEQCRGGSR